MKGIEYWQRFSPSHISAHSYLPNSYWEPLASELKSLTTKLRALKSITSLLQSEMLSMPRLELDIKVPPLVHMRISSIVGKQSGGYRGQIGLSVRVSRCGRMLQYRACDLTL